MLVETARRQRGTIQYRYKKAHRDGFHHVVKSPILEHSYELVMIEPKRGFLRNDR